MKGGGKILGAVFVAALLGSRAPTTEGQALVSDITENRIVGGHIAASSGKSWPWFVHLGICGGSLVAPDVVLT